MDDVARLARVSKQTIYAHVGSKEQLLVEVVTAIITEAGEVADELIAGLAESDEVERDLRIQARRQLGAVMQRRPMQLRRLVIAEAESFPDLGRLFNELGPGAAVDQFGVALARLHERGLVHAPDPRRAAADLNWLIMSGALDRAMLLGEYEPPGEDDIGRWADAAVTTFLAAYGRPTADR
jgi:AcrR family transcriptional regulator